MQGTRFLTTLLVLVAGCVGHLQPSVATFAGIPSPIMLSKVDRIGGGALAPVHKVAEFEGEAVSLYAHSETRTEDATTITTTSIDTMRVNNAELYNAAAAALQAVPNASIMITKLRPWASGYLSFVKNTVLVEGLVVLVGAP